MPSVDVIIPCYNYGRFLGECVDSVLCQDLDDLRIVIIDNASTDDSVAVARRLSACHDCVELVRHEKNLGAQASFNEGIDLARADYVMILCADDLLNEGTLGRACDVLDRHPEAVFALGTSADEADSEAISMEKPDDMPWRLVEGEEFIESCCRSLGFTLPLGAVLVRTPVQKAVGYYRDSLPYTDDLELALRLAMRGAVVEFDAALGRRREHDAQMSNDRFPREVDRLREREAAFNSFFEHEGARLAHACTLQRLSRRRLARVAYSSAISHLSRGKGAEGLALVNYAARLDPATLLAPPIRMKAARRRIAEVISDAFGRRAA